MKAVLIAAALGSFAFWAYEQTIGSNCSTTSTSGLIEGAVIGGFVQVGVMVLGVS